MATAIRPEDLPAAPALSASDAFIVDTGDGVFKTTAVDIVTAGGADVGLRIDLAEATGGTLIGMPDGKTLEFAALKNASGGLALTGSGASAVRPEGQLYLSNIASPPSGHTIITLDQLIANEEAAIEVVGRLSDNAIQQMGALFARWYQDNNNVTTKQTVWALHGVGASQDNTPLEVWPGFNSVRVCRGDTSLQSWHSAPPVNVFEVYTKQKIGTSLYIGTTAAKYDTNTAQFFRLEVEGRAQFGSVSGTTMDKAVQIGGGAVGFINSFDNVATSFLPLGIAASDLTLANSGQKIGFYGATPVSRPTITGSRGGNVALASLLTALAGLGLVTDSSTA